MHRNLCCPHRRCLWKKSQSEDLGSPALRRLGRCRPGRAGSVRENFKIEAERYDLERAEIDENVRRTCVSSDGSAAGTEFEFGALGSIEVIALQFLMKPSGLELLRTGGLLHRRHTTWLSPWGLPNPFVFAKVRGYTVPFLVGPVTKIVADVTVCALLSDTT